MLGGNHARKKSRLSLDFRVVFGIRRPCNSSLGRTSISCRSFLRGRTAIASIRRGLSNEGAAIHSKRTWPVHLYPNPRLVRQRSLRPNPNNPLNWRQNNIASATRNKLNNNRNYLLARWSSESEISMGSTSTNFSARARGAEVFPGGLTLLDLSDFTSSI